MNLDISLLLLLGLLGARARIRDNERGSTGSSATVSPALRKVVANATRSAAARRAAAQQATRTRANPAQQAVDRARQAAAEAAVTQAIRAERERQAAEERAAAGRNVSVNVGPAQIISPAAPEQPIVMPPPIMPAGPIEPRSKLQAAHDLRKFLADTKRFGTKTDRPREVQEAQRDLGVVPDGIVGPITRAATRKLGVTLPAK